MKRFIVTGIILLFICMSITPSFAFDIVKKSSTLVSNGNTLYVGGSGEGNYTRIQDAIDNASGGYTIFVYAGTYFEFITIEKTITLIGEDQNLTIIDIDHLYPQPQGGIVIHVINAPNVTIDSFCFRNHFSYNITGGIWAENCPGLKISNISDSWHHAVDFGFRLRFCSESTITQTFIKYKTDSAIDIQDSFNVTILENYILGTGGYTPYSCGISLIDCENILISNNTITKCTLYGIFLLNSDKNTLVRNDIQDNIAFGLYLLGSNNNFISNNELSFNHVKGIFINTSKQNTISKNNIYDNGEKYIFFSNAFFNTWNQNFWGDGSSKRQLIVGLVQLERFNLSFPILKVDWHPAQEPYEIPMGV